MYISRALPLVPSFPIFPRRAPPTTTTTPRANLVVVVVVGVCVWCVCVCVCVWGGGGKAGDARDEHVGGGEDGRGWERVEVVVVVVVAVVVVVVVVEDWRRQLTLRKKEEGLSEQVLNLCPILAQRARLLFLSSLGDTHNDYKTTHRTTLGNIYKSHPLASFRHLKANASFADLENEAIE